jgi:hypothetical protein
MLNAVAGSDCKVGGALVVCCWLRQYLVVCGGAQRWL